MGSFCFFVSGLKGGRRFCDESKGEWFVQNRYRYQEHESHYFAHSRGLKEKFRPEITRGAII